MANKKPSSEYGGLYNRFLRYVGEDSKIHDAEFAADVKVLRKSTDDIRQSIYENVEVVEDDINADEMPSPLSQFMSNPAAFWNLAPIEVKGRIQDAIFPEGLEYDCETGFRTAKLAESYLLLKKIASEDAKNPSLVAATGILRYNLRSLRASQLSRSSLIIEPVTFRQLKLPSHWFGPLMNHQSNSPTFKSGAITLVAATGIEPVTLGL